MRNFNDIAIVATRNTRRRLLYLQFAAHSWKIANVEMVHYSWKYVQFTIREKFEDIW